MKVTILNVQAPFIRGGAEYLADSLAERIQGRGHQVETIGIPFKWYPAQAIAEHMFACRMMHIHAGDPDLVIGLKFPAYLVPFENKKLWLLHQFRQAYELWGTEYAGMPNTPESKGIRRMIQQADNKSLGDVRELYTISKTVAGRLKQFNDIDATEVLYPPLRHPEMFGPGEYGDYFFYPSRLNTAKRQHIAIEAMRHVQTGFRLVLAGKPDSDAYGDELHHLVEKWELQDRVQFLGWITEEEKARWMANARAAVFLPYEEDYGYVTLEAFHSHKPLVTFTDAGGPNELVEDRRNGLVTMPTPEALAEALNELANDVDLVRDLGVAGAETLKQHRIGWEHILDRLLAK